MVVKVLFEDGICSGVYMDEEAKKQNIQVTVIDANDDFGTDEDLVEEEIENLKSVPYDLTHCREYEEE